MYILCIMISIFCYLSRSASSSELIVNLTRNEMKEWYTTSELNCMMDIGNCPYFMNCKPPLKWRSFWKKGIKGYTNHSSHTIHKLWSSVRDSRRNYSIIFAGDSITGQKLNFLFMDSQRHYVDMRISMQEERRVCPKHRCQRWTFENRDPKINATLGAFNVAMHVTGPRGIHSLAAKYVDIVNYEENSNAIVLAYMGAHFNDRAAFQDKVRSVMEWLKAVALRTNVVNKVVWLSPWPQHFNSSLGNGYYEANTSVTNCVSHSGDMRALDWRYNIIFSLVKKPEYAEHIQFFSDTALMNPLFDMHKSDCTHYCFSPTIHQLLYEVISKIIRQFYS